MLSVIYAFKYMYIYIYMKSLRFCMSLQPHATKLIAMLAQPKILSGSDYDPLNRTQDMLQPGTSQDLRCSPPQISHISY